MADNTIHIPVVVDGLDEQLEKLREMEAIISRLKNALPTVQEQEEQMEMVSGQSGNQTDILLQKLLDRFEEFLLIWLRSEHLDHSSGSELYRDLCCSKERNQNRTDISH